MRVKMILPALTEAKSPFFRPIKYSLFPPLGLATLAGYLRDDDEVVLQDEHVEKLDLDDEPDLVVIQVYITSARRAYELAGHYRRKGARVALDGLGAAVRHLHDLHRDWDLYDTRHVVFRTCGMSADELESGYWRAYRDFYRWSSILRGASSKDHPLAALRHFAYAAGWKKFEPLWDRVIRTRQVLRMRPALEQILRGFGRQAERVAARPRDLRARWAFRGRETPAAQASDSGDVGGPREPAIVPQEGA